MADPWAGFRVVAADPNDPWSQFRTVDDAAAKKADMAGRAEPAAATGTERPTYSNIGEAALGAAKALGTGAFKGLVGLGTLLGNVEALGRAGLNRAGRMVGVGEVVSPENLNPVTYPNLMGRLEARFGKTYEPQTTAEKYIQSIGEFAPAALTGGAASVGQRAAQVVAPAVASEAAGQATEGTSLEPWARVGGALAGGTVANLGARSVTPAPALDPVKAAHVQELQRQGVTTLTAGQKTGNARVRALEDASMTMPGGGRAQAMQIQSLEEFTSSALEKAGIQGATRATPDVIDAGFSQLGRQYEQVGQVARVVADRGFGQRLQTVVADYNKITPSSQRVPLIGGLAADIKIAASKPGGMTGQEYLGFRSNIRRAERQMTNNPQAKEALGRLVEHLDVQMIRSAPRQLRPKVALHMRYLNERYRSMLAIEAAANRAGEKAAIGLLSPQALNAELKKQSKRLTARHSRELGRLAAAGDDILRDLKSSGTAERNQAISMLKSPSSIASGGAGAVLSGGDPLTMGAAYLAPLAIQAASARAVTNPLLQSYLSNQRLPARVNAEASRRAGASMVPYLMMRDEQPTDPYLEILSRAQR